MNLKTLCEHSTYCLLFLTTVVFKWEIWLWFLLVYVASCFLLCRVNLEGSLQRHEEKAYLKVSGSLSTMKLESFKKQVADIKEQRHQGGIN